MEAGSRPGRSKSPDAHRIRKVILDYVGRKANGEHLDDSEIVAQHPELKPELEKELTRLQRIANARQYAQETLPATSSTESWSEPPVLFDASEARTAAHFLYPNRLHELAPASTADAQELSAAFPDYELIRRCGEGSFGKVWVVRDRAGVYRAMKTIRLDRLRELGIPHRELLALGRYCRGVPTHVNLVQVFHISHQDRFLAYTMELADDLRSRAPIRDELPDGYEPMTLLGLMVTGRMSVDTAVEVTLRLTNGLKCLHHAGLVHRDIKPANILFVNRQVKLGDVSLISTNQTEMSMVGTPGYMPPDGQMDCTADTYALGKVLFELLTGGDLSDFPQLPENGTMHSSRIDVHKLRRFLMQACASSSGHRFTTADEMGRKLLDCRFALCDSPLRELLESEPPTPPTPVIAKTRRQVPQGDEVLWAVIDRLILMLPWIVLLILGLFLIGRLT